MANIQNIHLITRMKNILLEKYSAKRLTLLIKDMQEFANSQDLDTFVKEIEDHILLGDDAHSKKRIEDPKTLLKTLFLEWLKIFPESSYDDFIYDLPNVILYHLHTTPNEPTDEKKDMYALTTCSLIYCFNKYHNYKTVDNVHNGRFIESINNLINLLIKNQTYIFNPSLCIDEFNVDSLQFERFESVIEREGYVDIPEEDLNKPNRTYLKYLSPFSALDSIFTGLDRLKEIRDTLIEKQPIIRARFITRVNQLYYKPVNLSMNTLSSGMFIEFDLKPVPGITVIYAFTDEYGMITSSLLFDYEDKTFKFLLHVNEYTNSESELVSEQDIVINVHTVTDLSDYKRHRFIIQFSQENSKVTIRYHRSASVIDKFDIPLDTYALDTLYPLFNVGLTISGYDNYKMMSIKKIIFYDADTYKQAHLELFNMT